MNKKNFILTLTICILTCCGLLFYTKSKNVYDDTTKSSINANKIVYLTFDDGPCKTTNVQILDVLKKYNVKATFFLVGNQVDGNEEVIHRIYNEGHGIGSHSYSHNYKKIYSNDAIFIKEMLDTREKLKKVLGFAPKPLRFPGGSYKHLSKSMLKELHEKDFKVFDWNVDTKDGINPNLSPDKIQRNAQKYIKTYKRLIVLMHCNSANKNSVKALPKIIEYYKNQGYEFKSITDDTKEYYYKIRR